MVITAQPLSASTYYDRILKVSRTIADLGGIEQMHAQHVAEAIQYGPLAHRPSVAELL